MRKVDPAPLEECSDLGVGGRARIEGVPRSIGFDHRASDDERGVRDNVICVRSGLEKVEWLGLVYA